MALNKIASDSVPEEAIEQIERGEECDHPQKARKDEDEINNTFFCLKCRRTVWE